MSQERWTVMDSYFEDKLAGADDALISALAASDAAGIPAINVTANQGKLLYLLAQVQGAQRILEIGTLAGYSTIWLARALPANGHLVTLEMNPTHAKVAQRNLDRAGVADRVDIRLGRAVNSLQAMIDAGEDSFDFVFIDADKPSNVAYLELSLKLSKPGTLIFLDNVVRNGAVGDPQSTNLDVVGVRAVLDEIAANPRLSATAIQTVGSKGYDGFSLIRVS